MPKIDSIVGVNKAPSDAQEPDPSIEEDLGFSVTIIQISDI